MLRSGLVGSKKSLVLNYLVVLSAFLGSALIPWALGRLLDSGLEKGLTSALIPGSLLLAAVVFYRALGGFDQVFAIQRWARAGTGALRAMNNHVAGMRGGGKQKMASGEIVAAATSDHHKVGNLAWATPNTLAAMTSFLVIVGIMISMNTKLGLIIATAMPIVVVGMSFLQAPMQARMDKARDEQGKLTTLATDAVVGLRMLRGVGGEDVYAARYKVQSEHLRDTSIRAARMMALIGAFTTAAPAIFTALVVGVGLMSVYDGTMTVGEVVAFYGFTGYLAIPVSSAAEFFLSFSDAKIGASRMEKILELEPVTDDSNVDAEAPVPNWPASDLVDGASNVRVRAGLMTALVSASPAVSAALAERLARVDDADEAFVVVDGERVSLRSLPLATVRDNIVLSDAVAQIFQGRLRSNVAGRHGDVPVARTNPEMMANSGDGSGLPKRSHERPVTAPSEEDMLEALQIADAEDIALGLEDGLEGYIAERGRSLSGGQRQRLALARAVLTRAPILVLVEPTSAVDSHTESRIAGRLTEARSGRTTVIVTSSPLMLDKCDEVVLVDENGEVARGPHHELLADARYHSVVHRAAGGEA